MIVSRSIPCSVKGQEIESVWRYDAADPYVVVMAFTVAEERIPWTVSRDVLSDAFSSVAAGHGDVRIQVGALNVAVYLSSCEGSSVVMLPRDDVEAFLAATVEACPFGAEFVDVDACILQLLA